MKIIGFSLLSLCVGVLIGLLVSDFRTAAAYHRTAPEPSSEAMPRPMRAESLDPASIRSGDPVIHGATFCRTTGGSTLNGVWVCEGPAVIEVDFPADEWVYVLDGGVDVDYLGRRFALQVGDAALFQAGTTAIWTVPDMLKKVWVYHAPDAASRRLARFF